MAMGIATFVEDFKRALELKPIAGSQNLCVIRFRPGTPASDKAELTPEEWDKFEKTSPMPSNKSHNAWTDRHNQLLQYQWLTSVKTL